VKNKAVIGGLSDIVNISIAFQLDAIKAVSFAENYDGIGLEKVLRVLESP